MSLTFLHNARPAHEVKGLHRTTDNKLIQCEYTVTGHFRFKRLTSDTKYTQSYYSNAVIEVTK